MTRRHVRPVLLGSGVAFAVLMAGLPASADRIDELRTEIDRLQDQLGQLERAQGRRRRTAPAAAVEAGSQPRSWKLPGTNTSIQIGGYAKLDLIYDVNDSTGDLFDLNTLAGNAQGAARNRQGNFRLHARQSRLWIRTWTPTDWGQLETHLQGDFFGGGGNQVVSNSNSFRLRHAYGRLGPVLAGQTWSTFMILSSLANTLDFNGPAGIVFIRQAQIRYTHSFGGGTTLQVAVENPEFPASATFVAAPGGVAAATGGSPNDPVPDFVFKLNHRWSSGNVAIAGLIRYLNLNDGGTNGLSETAIGWALHVGGGWRFNNGRTSIGGNIVGGKGIGRYTLPVAPSTVLNGTNSTNLSLDTVAQIAGSVWIQHHITDTLRANVAYGRIYSDVTSENSTGAGGKNGIAPGTLQDGWTVHANLIWRPAPQVDLGVEYIYGFAGAINGVNGQGHRIQIGMQYRF